MATSGGIWAKAAPRTVEREPTRLCLGDQTFAGSSDARRLGAGPEQRMIGPLRELVLVLPVPVQIWLHDDIKGMIAQVVTAEPATDRGLQIDVPRVERTVLSEEPPYGVVRIRAGSGSRPRSPTRSLSYASAEYGAGQRAS